MSKGTFEFWCHNIVNSLKRHYEKKYPLGFNYL